MSFLPTCSTPKLVESYMLLLPADDTLLKLDYVRHACEYLSHALRFCRLLCALFHYCTTWLIQLIPPLHYFDTLQWGLRSEYTQCQLKISGYTAYICIYKLGGSSPECGLADSRGISDLIPRVWQNMYFYCSNYISNQFIIAIRHLRVCGVWPIYHC